ncbi:MAG: hypothetical protein LBN98_03195 [Prevotellaceae bacterium]|jgi:hypothetical protein|nr:hypothetical protein [Prevotellaceae bacterium]
MKNTVLLLAALFSFYGLKAQTDYRAGYVITLANDTIYGQIDYRGEETMGLVCRFMSDAGVKTAFSPDSIKAYRFIDSKYYVSREVKGRKYFLEFLIQGKMNVYFLRNEYGDGYYVEKEDSVLTRLPYEKKLIHVKDKEYIRPSVLHYGILYYMTKEAPQLEESIRKIKIPNHPGLIKLAKNYHEIVCSSDEKCIIFERPLPLFKIKAEAVAGYYRLLRNDDFYTKKQYYFYGAKIYFWMPRSSENMYFKTGFLYAADALRTIASGTRKENIIKIPLQFEYLYPKGKFRPSFAGGLNFYAKGSTLPSYAFIPAYSAGCVYLLNSHTAFSFTCELETLPLPYFGMLPSWRLLGISATAGIQYSF